MEVGKYISALKERGAGVACELSPAAVVTAPWPVMKCRYGCPRYGHNRACPPFAPDYRETRRILDSYTVALVFSVSQMSAGTPLALEVCRMAVADGFYKAIAFGTGPCMQCADCSVADCPRPASVAPSMEACGIDVVATVRAAGLPIEVPPRPGDELNCYGLILLQ